MTIFEKARFALEEQIPISIEVEDGTFFPHEEVVRVDYNGMQLFWVKLSREGAAADPMRRYHEGDVVVISIEDDIEVSLLTT